jgi:hypothetical protein
LALTFCKAAPNVTGRWTAVGAGNDQQTIEFTADGRFTITSAVGIRIITGAWELRDGELCGLVDELDTWQCHPYSVTGDELTTQFVWPEEMSFRRARLLGPGLSA